MVYPIFRRPSYGHAMQLDFANALPIVASTAVFAAAVGALRGGKKKPPSLRQAQPNSKGNDGLTVVQFEFSEIPAIRNLLGPEVAAALLAGLAHKASDLGLLAMQPEISVSAITMAFGDDGTVAVYDKISVVSARLAEATNVAGAKFSCTVRATVLDDGARALERPEEARGAGRMNGPEHDCVSRLKLLQDLRIAMDNGELALAYQPKLDLRTNAITSAEALLRWTRSDGEMVHTGDLIALCEQTGTIKELTRWTLGKAIADSEEFLASGFELLVFVNISGALMADRDFADDILTMVSKTSARVGIEITETAVIADPAVAIGNLTRFAQAGIAIAIDDFGAGLSSLEYLQQLPASELKIDRTFIDKLSSSHRNPLIIRATIDLAHALEMRVTAEGVDDQLSMALLKIMGCDLAQGYLISHPLDPQRFMNFLARQNAPLGVENFDKAAQ
jgi:EAL domain-containing protein (putative c-di-GMP-specific phosphodiesterase class I)